MSRRRRDDDFSHFTSHGKGFEFEREPYKWTATQLTPVKKIQPQISIEEQLKKLEIEKTRLKQLKYKLEQQKKEELKKKDVQIIAEKNYENRTKNIIAIFNIYKIYYNNNIRDTLYKILNVYDINYLFTKYKVEHINYMMRYFNEYSYDFKCKLDRTNKIKSINGNYREFKRITNPDGIYFINNGRRVRVI